MRLKIRQVFNAMQVLDAIIRERRPMPQLGKFRLARMHTKLLAEFATANAQRDELIRKHGNAQSDGQFMVGADFMAEFAADWDPIADAEVDVDIEPIRLADLVVADPDANGAIEASELLMLGELVTE